MSTNESILVRVIETLDQATGHMPERKE